MKPNSYSSAIAVTGIGALLPTGVGVQALWEAWCQQQSGLSTFGTRWLNSRLIPRYGHVASEHEEQARQLVPHKLRRYASPSTVWGMHAAQQAMTAAGVDPADTPGERRGLFTAQADYSNPSLQSFQRAIMAGQQEQGFDAPLATQEALLRRGVDPFLAIKSLANNQLALLSLTHGFRGAGGAFVQNESACLAALDAARFSLEQAECDWALVVGSGSYLCPLILKELYHNGELSSATTTDALRCFDTENPGTVLADGAVAFVLERADRAQSRGAPIQLLLQGMGSHAPSQIGVWDDSGYRHAVQQAGMTADLSSIDALLVTGHGGTEQDSAELAALQQLLEGSPKPVTTPRPVVGLVAGCGPFIDLALAAKLFAEQYLPAIPFLSEESAVSQAPLTLSSRSQAMPLKRLLCLHQGRTGFYSALALAHPSSLEDIR